MRVAAPRKFAVLIGTFAANACASTGPNGGSVEARPAQETEADQSCLKYLEENQVAFRFAPHAGLIRTPVEPLGPIAGVSLVPRVGRAPVMDCELLRALIEAGPIFADAGITELQFSGAYDHRTRRGSTKLSAHAYGLAIDAHAFCGPAGTLDVTRDFEAGVGTWVGLVPSEGEIDACIGQPTTDAGRRLRTLVCRLKHHSAFRVIVTPDDNSDHRDHLHLEAFADSKARVARVLGARLLPDE
jgi:hypothetical protein